MQGLTLSLDVWSLVFQHTEKNDLCSLCLVSRTFNTLATPLLYRSISLIALDPNRMSRWRSKEQIGQGRPTQPTGHWYLLSRLEDETHSTPRHYVQELALSIPKAVGQLDKEFLTHLLKDSRLFNLISFRLPNLRRVSLTLETLQSEPIIRAIENHPRKPELTLSIQNAGKPAPEPFGDAPLPSVTKLTVTVSPFDEGDGQNRRVLVVQRLLFNCPNVRSLSLTVRWKYGGCVRRRPRYPITTSFQFSGTEVFPPIEELLLDGYRISDDEWPHWRDRFEWSRLSSLTLGPQNTSGVLSRFAGYATALAALSVRSYRGERNMDREGLTVFLSSFDSLKMLDLRGYICSVRAIAQHSKLETLCLHEDESAGEGSARAVLTVEELEYLDKQCPNLRVLKVDIQRGDNQLPTTVLTKLATGFKNLRSLSLHFELGLRDIKHPITPTLNYVSVQSIGQSFFDERIQYGIADPTSSFALTLWTGNCYRRWPQWEPPHASFEKQFTASYEIRLSEGAKNCVDRKVEVRHLQKERLDALIEARKRNIFGDLSAYEFSHLRTRVAAAVEGPTEALMEEVGKTG
ncbi:hypothetical protein BJY01DRAFT_229112 [Aspergillus pseudoustus]|uniref:F-box domain-containing protein n=1 Tax=Aspergillus pseudoustus TaxID=1810923 RepID=A0ABR4II81_9EURO